MKNDDNALLMREIERTREERAMLYDELERQKEIMAERISVGAGVTHGPVIIRKSWFKKIKEKLSVIFGGRQDNT